MFLNVQGEKNWYLKGKSFLNVAMNKMGCYFISASLIHPYHLMIVSLVGREDSNSLQQVAFDVLMQDLQKFCNIYFRLSGVKFDQQMLKKRAHRTHIIENQISYCDPAARNVSADTTWKKQFVSLCIHKGLNLRSSVQCLGWKCPTLCVKGPETPSSSPSPSVWQKSKSCRNLPVIVLRFLRNHTYLYRWTQRKQEPWKLQAGCCCCWWYERMGKGRRCRKTGQPLPNNRNWAVNAGSPLVQSMKGGCRKWFIEAWFIWAVCWQLFHSFLTRPCHKTFVFYLQHLQTPKLEDLITKGAMVSLFINEINKAERVHFFTTTITWAVTVLFCYGQKIKTFVHTLF